MMAIGPQLIGVQPNRGELLDGGDIRNVAPEQLTFRFDEGQVIDAATLDGIRVTRAGGDGSFASASGRTDFNTLGRVVMEFRALDPGPSGNELSLVFTKGDRGGAGAPRVTVVGKTISVELNSNSKFRTTAAELVTAINNHAVAKSLVQAVVVSGSPSNEIASPPVIYSPVELTGANIARVSTNFNTTPLAGRANLDVAFTAVEDGAGANGIAIEVTKRDRGGAAPPQVQVLDDRHIRIELNTNPGNQTTAGQLVSVFNANADARELVVATLRAGDPDTNIATPLINYSPLTLRGADDVLIEPGYIGLGDTAHEVIFRFAERLPDDLYRVDIAGSGPAALRNEQGFGLGDQTDNRVDDGVDFSLQFELDLGVQILGVVPQPVMRTSSGALVQSASQIEVFFNNDDLDPVTATNPAFYQLIDTNNTVETSDDVVRNPVAVQYFAASDRAMLTFSSPLQQLSRGGAFRLRIGTSEVVASQNNPLPPVVVDLQGADPGSSFSTAHNAGVLSGTQIVTSAIDPQVHDLQLPGSNDEPGHRDLTQYTTTTFPIETHLHGVADADGGIATLFYNFREDYGLDPEGNPLNNLISSEQKQRAREAFEIWEQQLGVRFIESATQGFTIATGDMRAIDPAFVPLRGDGVLYANTFEVLENELLLVLDNAENWYEGFGSSDDPAKLSWFETALSGIGSLLGLGDTFDLPPGTVMGSEPGLGFGQTEEAIYPGDQDIVHGQHLYRPESGDIDLYRFEVTTAGRFTAETLAERREETSLLDSVISLYREVNGQRQLVARNDDYFSDDSYLERELQPGVYYLGVSASGNEDYNPVIEDTGYGGKSQGDYELRLSYRPEANQAIVDLDNGLNDEASATSQATALDGDGDGVPGGVFNFWFRVDATTIFVDKAAAAGGAGSLTTPYNNLATALASALPGDVVRVVGNGGADGLLSTPEDALPYQIGFDLLGRALPDGSKLDVPRGVTLMVDPGAVFKLRRAHIDAGSVAASIDRSAGALQVLGTPRLLDLGGNVIRDTLGNEIPGSVYFTSYNDETLGGDSNPAVAQTPQAGDWGGLMFRNDVDRANNRFDYEREGIFLNYVNQAELKYGGGTVLIQGIPQLVAPVDATDARPTVTYNTISHSADAAIAANPNSFEETNFHAPEYQDVRFTSDYRRVGPDIHGNRVVDNSINGLFIRVSTPTGNQLQEMTVSGKWDDTDIVHVVSENLRIRGNPGGPLQTLEAPHINLVQVQTKPGGTIPEGPQTYRMTFVDAAGNETPASDATPSVNVRLTDALSGATQSVQLTNLPAAGTGYVGRRLYRSVKFDYVLVAELDVASTSYLDTGTVLGGLLQPSREQLTSRLDGRLDIASGTIVKLNKAGIETAFGSQLIAEGLQGREIVFTSLLDSRYGAGGTFATSAEGEVQRGDWSGLYFGYASRGSVDKAVIAFGGGVAEIPGTFAAFNPVEVHRAEVRMAHTLLESNAGGVGGQSLPNRGGRGTNAEGAVFVRGAQPVLLGNTFYLNGGPVINIDVNSLNGQLVNDPGRSTGDIDRNGAYDDNAGPLIRENRVGFSDVNAMHVRGGTLTTQGVWDDSDIVHTVRDERIIVPDFHTYGGLRLESSPTESLVVKLDGAEAGFTATGQPLDITDRIGGSLQLIGQPNFPVVLTSIEDCTVGAGFRHDGRPQTDTINSGACAPADQPTDTSPYIDLIVVMDESASMAFAQQFSIQLIADLDAALVSQGIGDGTSGVNQFGLVGYGNGLPGLDDLGRALPVGGATQLFGSSAQYAIAAAQLTDFGVQEDGYAAMDFALDNYTYRADAAKFVLLVTNEDRDILDPTLTYTSTLTSLLTEGVILDSILEVDIQDVNGAFAVAADAAGSAYLADGNGGFSISPVGSIAPIFPFETTVADYVDLTFDTDGVVGDITQIQFGGDVTTSFANSLITTIGQQAGAIAVPGTPGDWGSVRFEQYSNDRNVDAVTEWETGKPTLSGTNEVPGTAQYLGELAPHEKAGDDVRRLGFEINGTLNRPADLDVYSFDGRAGTEVWFDIDRTGQGLDTVVELIDDNGRVLARSDNSPNEAANPALLVRDATVLNANQVNPLTKSASGPGDLWSTNPRDAGMRVVLPGASGALNTYHVRVRSSSSNLNNVQGGLTSGPYQLQLRLRELDEVPGSTVQAADIRFATTGIELVGMPAHSPLAGEAAEINDPASATRDDNNDQATADVLGNLLNTDRGTLSVAGELFTSGDVDWYQFEVRYDSIDDQNTLDPRHLATIFDIDYADGFARPNTNLWVFDDQGRLVLIGRDSNTPDDRPAGADSAVSDLTRGSIGALDPFIGSVELPAGGFTTGQYYVAVSSNAVIPEELQQLLTPAPTNPLVRLEPVNSVNRVAEDHIGTTGYYTTGNSPAIPVLFGESDVVSLFPPAGNKLRDGETFSIRDASGASMTYEFDLDGRVSEIHAAVPFQFNATPGEIGAAIAAAVNASPPSSGLQDPFNSVPTADAPLVFSSLSAFADTLTGQVRLTEFVNTVTLLNEITTTDFFTNQLLVTPIYRQTFQQQAPQLRQLPAQGSEATGLYISRPAAQEFTLGDVTMFVSQPGGFLNRTELVSVDPFTGQLETRIGAFGASVSDIALDPRGMNTATGGNDGGIFAYAIPQTGALNDDTVGNYIQINPGSATPATLGVDLGNVGLETYEEDPNNLGDEVRSGDDGVGVFFHAITFNTQESSQNVRGFAIGTRGDTFVDPVTGTVTSGAFGIPNPANILFEFNPNTGEAINPPNTNDRDGGAILTAGGTQIRDRGALDTSVDAFPSGGANTTITGVDATTPDAQGIPGNTQFNIEDGDVFEVDQDGDGIPDVTFEFDSGPEFYFNVNPAAATPLILLDGDTFVVDGIQFEFDTGSVLVVNATNGTQLVDGGTILITDNSPTPSTVIFEFDNNGNSGGNTAITFTAADNQQSIIAKLVTAINNAPNFGVTAIQLPGTNRITLLNESATSGATVNASGVALLGSPGVGGTSVRVPVEESWSVDQIANSLATVIDGTQGGNFQAGAVGNRVNFAGALTASFAGVTNPVFGTINPNTTPPTNTGIGGTINNFNFPVPFLASDNSAEIATRVHAALVNAGFSATQVGATVYMDQVTPPEPQAAFVCVSLGTPPLIGAPGVQDCPLKSGGVAPGGQMTGMAFIGNQLYAVTDTGALFRVANSGGGAFSQSSQFNVADYIDGSRELLQAANPVVSQIFDPISGEITEVTTYEPIEFSGLVAGPQNAEGGRYANLLFGIDADGRVFALDTHGQPQPVFAGGAYFVETGVSGANGLAFSNLDDNLWHVTSDPTNRHTAGHGVNASFDGSRRAQAATGNSSFYFGYENDQAQSQFGTNNFAPATQDYTYDFPGGAQGSLVSNSFSLNDYASADRPTLYFNYYLETEQADLNEDTSLFNFAERMRDAVRVYISGDDGRWQLLTTNNSDRDPQNADGLDEFDPFTYMDPETGQQVSEQLFRRGETFDNSGSWRQARVDLAPYAGQSNLRLRFDFSTAGGMSTGGLVLNPGDVGESTMDLNVAGNELRAVAGSQLADGQMFTLTDLVDDGAFGSLRDVIAGFEFDMGPSIVAPTAAAIDDGDRFTVDGRVYEFDFNGAVGVTNSVPHTAVPLTGNETAGELAELIQSVLADSPPPSEEIIQDLVSLEPSETLSTALASPLDGSTQILRGIGMIGDNSNLTDFSLDVDMIGFRLDAGDTVSIETDTTSLATQLNTYLRLFDADGNQLAANDNKDPTNPFSRDSQILFTASQRGTYYVGVSASHNTGYLPNVANSGSSSGLTSQGFYEYRISVTDPSGPQRVGNRLNLPNATSVTVEGLPASFVEGAGGVSASIPDSNQQPVPVVAVPVHAGMSNLHVADAIRLALADHFANGNVDVFKTRNEIVQVVKYGVGDAGPLGLSGPSDLRTARPYSGLFGDYFGSFGSSAGSNGRTTQNQPGALRMQDNQYEGVYIDDIIIGFAARGEMVTGSTVAAGNAAFVTNTTQPDNEIDRGAYQLEIRQGTPYGLSDPLPSPTLALTDGFDVNDRLAEGVSLRVQDGSLYSDGQTFRLSSGARGVTFEFDDLNRPGGVQPGHLALAFDPSDDAIAMARRIRDVINSAPVQQQIQVRAVTSDGVYTGSASNSTRLHLFGDVGVQIGLVGNGPTGDEPVAESNDTLATAAETGLLPGGRAGYQAVGVIGDNAGLAALGADVDLYRVELTEGELVTVDIDASELNSPLDSVLRVFDAAGEPLLLPNLLGALQPVASDDDLAPGERLEIYNNVYFNRDSYLSFQAPADGVYYIGVSAFDNDGYDPLLEGSGRGGQTGSYTIQIQRPLSGEGLEATSYDRTGDQNTIRDQGQVVIESSRISKSLNFGISVDAGPRNASGAPSPGPVRNLSQVNTSRLVPGVAIVNNIVTGNTQGGISLNGDPSPVGEQAAPVPFSRIVNNTIQGVVRESSVVTSLPLTALTGLAGGTPADTTVYYADLSTVAASYITSLTLTDNSSSVASDTGRFSGFDLDAVKLSTTLAADATGVQALAGLAGFDFTTTGTVLTPGTQVAPLDPDLFGTSGGAINGQLATLSNFDADAIFGANAQGFVSLGNGGAITFHFNPPLAITAPLYLYLGEVTDVGEGPLLTVQVTSPSDPTGVGIRVQNNVSPTLLNNVLSTFATGIEVDATSTSLVVGGSLYHNNLANTTGVGEGDFALVVDPSTDLFVNASRGNYYPAPGSPLIDSSIDSLEDRFEMIQLRTPLGIEPAPILAPTYDAMGQLRSDDPTVAPPPGLGGSVFKDRGATDRADFEGPTAQLRTPLDNGAGDTDPSDSRVNLFRVALDRFEIQLTDGQGTQGGIGVDDTTVTKESVQIIQDGRTLVEGIDYHFSYNTTSNIIRLTPLAGVWDEESSYVIELVGRSQHIVLPPPGDQLNDGDSFIITDAFGVSTTFEYDSGYVMQVPQTLALQIPLAGGAAGGVADGDTITVGNATRSVTLELDSNGVVATGNTAVTFLASDTRGEIADAIVAALKNTNLQLAPFNAGNGLIHLGVNGTQVMTLSSATILSLGVPQGVADGQQFTVDDGTRIVTFEFRADQFSSPNSVPIQFNYGQTHEQIAVAIAAAVNSQNLGLATRHAGDGVVQIGGGLNHIVTNLDANVTLSGQPGARLPFGIRIPTAAGAFGDLITDGQTFVISNGLGQSVTFEFDDNGTVTAGNTAVPYTSTTSTSQLANTLVNRIRNAGLGLFPFNAGNGIVALGGDTDFSLDVSNSSLTQTGQAGIPAAIAIPFVAAESFTAADGAQATADAINDQNLPGVTATVVGDRVLITGADQATGNMIGQTGSIRDLAGNELLGNQDDGDTRFTIFVGLGMDYGDAPSPYPTLRADDGARHVLLDGFSLGATVQLNADGLPSPNADADVDEDGVVFDPSTPLFPNRRFNLTVSTSGISGANPVVPFGVLDAWIDWNRDGDWNDTNERLLANQILTPTVLVNGQIVFRDLLVPPGAVAGVTYARFRLSTAGSSSPTGEVDAGEVEDYRVTITTNPWQNPTNRFDVNNSGEVSPVDVLLVINYLNANADNLGTPLPVPRPADQPYLDVNGNGFADPGDALQVINYINQLNADLESEGESAPAPKLAASHLDDVLSLDEGWGDILGDVDRAMQELDVRDAVFADLG